MLSARNQFEGTVKSVKLGGIMAEVVVTVGAIEIVSAIMPSYAIVAIPSIFKSDIRRHLRHHRAFARPEQAPIATASAGDIRSEGSCRQIFRPISSARSCARC